MPLGNFRRALIDADRELAAAPFVDERSVRTIVTERRRIRWRMPVLAVAALAIVLVVVRARPGDDAPTVAAVEVPPGVELPGFGHVVVAQGARIERIDGGIEVVRGRVDVAVAHRPVGTAPALVRVSHGTIAVLGTRFTIEQRDDGGSVVLHEGRIRFDDGVHSVVLVPGGSLAWPLAPAPARIEQPVEAVIEASKPKARDTKREAALPAPVVAPPPIAEPVAEPAPPGPPAPPAQPAVDIDAVIARVADLRARRRFADAATLLEQTLTDQVPSTSYERLSYELGELLTYQLANRDRACSHWRAHRTRFAHGRYTAEIDAAVRRLGCEGTPP